MTTATPFHHAQILRSLPAWSKDLHAEHASTMLDSLRKEYLDADGKPYDWYQQAPEVDRQALRGAIAVRDASRRLLRDALGPLKGITEFCRPLLQRRLALDVPVDRAQYVHQPTQVQSPIGISPSPGGQPPRNPGKIVAKGEPQPRSLLEAALHNFEGLHDTTRLSRLQRDIDDSMPLPGLTLAAFITHCRELDLGQRYQAHLSAIHDGPQADALHRFSTQARRDELRVQTRIARLRDRLTAAGSAALHGLCAGAEQARYGDQPVHCWRLSLFQIPLHEWLVIGPNDPAAINPVILYMPGSDTPLMEFGSASEAMAHLHRALLDDTFFKRVVAQAPQALQAALKLRLKRALYHGDDQARDRPHIEVARVALPAQPWSTLETLHVQRLKTDARALAVPTADVDAKARLERLEHWLDIGLTVLNVAAMFVPALNPLMLTIGAAQIMGSVFHGVEAWEEGDNAQALAQLGSILLDGLMVAGIAGGAAVLKSSGFVDAMESIVVDGK